MTTYLINISPFLRFDGYHVLSDMLSMRNLQTRSFALTRWKIREVLFGLKAPIPEQFNSTQQTMLITYASLNWIYRFFLFLGIALMVYHMFFKALGIVLFGIEMIYFILNPIYQEIRVWWSMRTVITVNRHTIIFGVTLFLIGMIFFAPWQSQISLPATLSYQTKTLYADTPAQVVQLYITKGQIVKKNQLLAVLDSEKLDFKISTTKEKLNELQWQKRNTVYFKYHLDQKMILNAQINKIQTDLAQLQEQKNRLQIFAPLDGEVEFISHDLQIGAWIKAKQALMVLVNDKKIQLRSYVDGNKKDKTEIGQSGYFIPEDIDLAKIPVKVMKIISSQPGIFSWQNQNKSHLKYIYESAPISSYVASLFGGKIAVNADKTGKLTPKENVFLLLLKNTDQLPYQLPHVLRGEVLLNTKQETIAQRIWRQILILWVKESEF